MIFCTGFIFCACGITKNTLKRLGTFELSDIGISIDDYDDTLDIENIVSHLPVQDVVNKLEKKHDIKIQPGMFQDKEKTRANIEQFLKSSFWTVHFEPDGNNILSLQYSIKVKDEKFSVSANMYMIVKERHRHLFSETIELDWELIEGYLKRGGSDEKIRQRVEKLNEAILREPANASLYRERSKANAELRDAMAAFNDANRMIVLEPSAENYQFRAALLFSIGMLPDAMADLNKAIET
jgi:tetratricopeptide (TPR) repeat protein